jgi:hypothetical protein
MHAQFWSENLKGRPRRTWEDNIKMHVRESVVKIKAKGKVVIVLN